MKSSENNSPPGDKFTEFVDIVATLRGPEGCPWDKDQTPQSMRPFLLEEVYETIEAIEDGDSDHVREELGDVLVIVVMISRMYSETGDFCIGDVLKELNAKLIRRHPHVFGDEKTGDAGEVIKHWERIKNDIEGRSKGHNSAIDGIPSSYPPLERACKLQKKAAKKGFEWPEARGPKGKKHEKLVEIEKAQGSAEVEAEVGDLLFWLINHARHLGVDPALALRRTNAEFEKRFRQVEDEMKRNGESMEPGNIETMDRYWVSTKASQ